MLVILALLIVSAEPEPSPSTPVPNAHKIGQAASALRFVLDYYVGKQTKNPPRHKRFAIVRNVQCTPTDVPQQTEDEKADMLADVPFGPGQTVAAAECQYELIWIIPRFDSSAEYTGPRQKGPYRLNDRDQAKLSKKIWQSEKRIFHLTQNGPCHMMSRIPPKELDCGVMWFIPEPKKVP